MNRLLRIACLLIAVILAGARVASADNAQFVIVNINLPGVGFNDPTPAAPVGGNTGTTLGQQRLNAFTKAASIWTANLDSAVPIRIRAQFTPLGAGVLGSAGPISVASDGAVLYPIALANKIVGFDIDPTGDDINANFSTNFNFYLGLDNNHGALPDLVTVLLHEFAHGLGFLSTSNLNTGALFLGLPDVYNSMLFDNVSGKYWPQMTNAERLVSQVRWGQIVLHAPRVDADLPSVLFFGSPEVQVNSPAAIAGSYQFGTASFGPPIGTPNVVTDIVAAVDPADAAGPATTDGCSPFTNALAVAGKIALVERGTCGFAQKARNASAAGAAAVIIYNQAANAAAAPPAMGGDGINDAFVTIPAVSLRRADGLAIVGQLGGGVNAEIGLDMALRAGADAANHAKVYTPTPLVGGSSVSHYDTLARRNLLMEPAINGDLTHNVTAPDDLTRELLRDIGWYPDGDLDFVNDEVDQCLGSDLRATIFVGPTNTGVPNALFTNGCTFNDYIAKVVNDANNHGQQVSGVTQLANDWRDAGYITQDQRKAIHSAAAKLK